MKKEKVFLKNVPATIHDNFPSSFHLHLSPVPLVDLHSLFLRQPTRMRMLRLWDFITKNIIQYDITGTNINGNHSEYF